MKRRTKAEIQASPEGAALKALVRLVARRDHSRLELRQKLARHFDDVVIDRALSDADARGWLLSEQELAAKLAESLEQRMKSRPYIEAQLQKRGLPLEAVPESDEAGKIRRLVEKKFGTENLSLKENAQAHRFLRYRGFDDRWIRMVLKDEEQR